MDILLLSHFALSSFNGFQPFLFLFLVSLPALDISITKLSGFSTHVNHLSWLQVRRPNTAFQLPYSGLSSLQPGVHWAMVSSKAYREKDMLSSACGHWGPSVPSRLLEGGGWLLLAASRALPCVPPPHKPQQWLRTGKVASSTAWRTDGQAHVHQSQSHTPLLQSPPPSSPVRRPS